MGKNTGKYLWQDRKRTFLGLPWSFTIYSLDEERLYIKRGIFTVRQDEVRLYRIMDLSLVSTIGQRIFGLGTIKCCSADKSLGDFELKNIKRPEEVMELLSENVEKQRERKRVSSREFLHESDQYEEEDDDDNRFE
ncbi:MAG: PH domain-containing protein [Lachnospiraceae bacterium]|nr:PH domain-containing protein [Lachnospiraceae bacterium]